MEPTILIVEDDRDLACVLRDILQDEGYQVLVGDDGVDGVELAQKHNPDLILLDLMMPRMDGWEACELIRKRSDVPIIIITGRREEADKIRGLNMGADDYVVKPFSTLELVARIQATLRRYSRFSAPQIPEQVVQIDDRLTLDQASKQVFVDGRPVELSDIEYKLLSCFLERPGTVLTHQALLTQVWGREYIQETGYLKVYIYRLRSKIEQDPQAPHYIFTARGRGYYFQACP
jgi:two-component system KDP operon response regulator KdpE